MRLCKEDSTPSPILVRNVEAVEPANSLLLFDKSLEGAHVPCLFQGSIGVAYNKQALEDAKITHIVTCADGINARFEGQIKYLRLPLLDTPTQNIV
jgi:hypothetical protein